MTDIFGQFSALDIPAQENNFQSNSQHFISNGDSLTKGEHKHRYLFDFNLQIYFASP